MTPHPPGNTVAEAAGLVNRRYRPGRYRILDRNNTPDPHLPIDSEDAPVNRSRDPY